MEHLDIDSCSTLDWIDVCCVQLRPASQEGCFTKILVRYQTVKTCFRISFKIPYSVTMLSGTSGLMQQPENGTRHRQPDILARSVDL